MRLSRRDLTPVSEEEISTIRGLLGVSDKRISEKQKNAIRHLLIQHRILSNDKMKAELEEMGVNA